MNDTYIALDAEGRFIFYKGSINVHIVIAEDVNSHSKIE